VRRIAHAGFINSLAQVLIKVAAPGVPDFYQGTEFWDFHLVDPDNRRSVDYQARQQALAELEQDFTLDWNTAWQQLRKCWPDDRIKLFTVWRCLALRKQFPQVFTDGDYLPIRTTGDRVQHVLAWARRYEGTWLIAVTVLRSLKLTSSDAMAAFERSGARAALPTFDWGDTRIELPVEASSVWNNAFTKQRHIATEDSGKRQILPIADVLHDFPIALLYSDTTD
jgi:(1->4)-alpha-D-glucan 1-alpha-D-glucosylmutase